MPMDSKDTPESAAAPTFATSPEWIRPGQACRVVGVGRRTLHRWLQSGEIVCRRPSPGIVLVSRDSLRSFVENSAAYAAGER